MNERIHYCLDARSVTDHFPGIGRYVSNLAVAMMNQLRADEAIVLLLDKSRPSRWQLPAASEKTIVVETTVSPFNFAQQWQIPKLLHQHQVELYHSPYYLMPYFSALPTVVTIHDLIPQLFPEYFSARTRILSSWSKQLAMHRANTIITDSQATQQDILQRYGLDRHKVTAVPLAADSRFQPQPAAEIQRVRQKYDLPLNYLLYVGINKPHKNLPLLIQAYNMVSDQRKQLPPLVIAGAWDGRYPEARQLAERSAASHHIPFLGPVPDEDLAALYSGALFFLFPSLYEGFGLPVIEAMACGTAVICANASSLPEVAGDAAIYVVPNQPGDIAEKISYLLDHIEVRKKFERRAIKQAGLFSWQQTAVATLDIYRSLSRSDR